MKLTVAGRNIEITDAIHNHLDRRIEKNIQGLGEEADIHVALSVEKHRHFAEVTVKTKGYTVHAEEETNDLYTAMDNVLIKIEKQLKKHKNRTKDLRIKQASAEKHKLQE